jgi:hypothetical protein
MKQPNQTAPITRPELFAQDELFKEWTMDDPARLQMILESGVIGCHILSPWSRMNCI